MRNILAVFITFFVCASVWASRARPVSDLRFEGALKPYGGFVASDGKDFLFLSSNYSNTYVYVQRVVGGVPVGPSLGIGTGTAAGIAWTGIDYLVSWSAPSGMWTARVSRQGALIDESKRLVVSYPGSFASNAQSALAVARSDDTTVLAQPLDLSGRPSGPSVRLNLPRGPDTTVGPTANGFAIVSYGWPNTSFWRLRPDGTPLSASPVILEGPYDASAGNRSNQCLVATDGTDTLIVFAGEKLSADTELKTAIIGPDGTVKRPARTAFTIAGAGGRSLQPASVVWTGSEYVVALAVSKDPTGNFRTGDVGLVRISRTGDAVGDVVYTTSGERRKVPIGLGWNGSQLLVPWFDTNNAVTLGFYCAALPIATMIPSAPAVLGRTLNAQSGLTVAAKDGQYLAAWFENGAVPSVRASRVDNAGNFLDGEGILLAASAPPSQYSTGGLAIDSDGTNWLVVWSNGAVRGRRLSRAGVLLDAQPFPITGGSDVAVRWNGSNYVVIAGNDSLSTAAVSRDGVVTASRSLMTSSYQTQSNGSTSLTYGTPSLVVVRGETMAIYLNDLTTCYIGTPGGCGSETTIVGWRLDSSGNPVGAAFSIAKGVWSAKLATDGTHHLLAWDAYDAAVGTGSTFGTVLSADTPEQEGTPFRIASRASLRDVAFDGSNFLVAFQTATSPYTAGILRVTPAGAVKETVMLPLDDGESASNPAIATSPGMPALVGYLDVHPAYEGRSRGALLFNSEFTPSLLAAPSPPSVNGALRVDQNTIDVRWQPSADVFGTAVELQLEDGAFRMIGVAGGGTSSGRFSLAGLQGSAIRLRSWSAAGLSEGSTSVPIALPRQHSVRVR